MARGNVNLKPLTSRLGDDVDVRDVGSRTPKEKSTCMESCKSWRSTRVVGNAAAEAVRRSRERCMILNLRGQGRPELHLKHNPTYCHSYTVPFSILIVFDVTHYHVATACIASTCYPSS